MSNDIIDRLILNDEQMQAVLNSDDTFKVFDWFYFVDLINVCHIKNAKIGLYEDWESTSATALQDGKMANGFDESSQGVYLGSWWATPMVIDLDTNRKYTCFTSYPERVVIDEHFEAAEEWWPVDAAKYYAEKLYGDIDEQLGYFSDER